MQKLLFIVIILYFESILNTLKMELLASTWLFVVGKSCSKSSATFNIAGWNMGGRWTTWLVRVPAERATDPLIMCCRNTEPVAALRQALWIE